MWPMVIVSVIGFAGIGWVLFVVFRERSNHRFVAAHFPVGESHIFTGRYIVHWEIARFEWFARGRAPVWGEGLFCSLEWQGEFPAELLCDDRGGGRAYSLEFRGQVLERGSFGHRGMCSYRVRVDEVLKIESV